jgi:hypothetical protein
MDPLSQIELLKKYNATLRLKMDHLQERLRKISDKMDQLSLQKNRRK